MYIIVGLGNPGEEYDLTRHNTGRMVVGEFLKRNKFADLIFDKKLNALKSEGKIEKEKVLAMLPETFMNNSGSAVVKLISSKKKAEKLMVVHDDLDLPLGRFKISFARSSAGHRGVESIIKKIKTDGFIRIRVGISPKKKPSGKELLKLLLGKFSPKEMKIFKKTSKEIVPAMESVVVNGLGKAMSDYN